MVISIAESTITTKPSTPPTIMVVRLSETLVVGPKLIKQIFILLYVLLYHIFTNASTTEYETLCRRTFKEFHGRRCSTFFGRNTYIKEMPSGQNNYRKGHNKIL